MTSISRYIIREHLPPFFFSLAVIMFVFVTKFVVQYIGKLFGKGLSTLTIFEFIYLNLAWMLALAIPMAVLIASLMAFGRLSADNEITILKTAGINLYRIISPVLLCATLLTLGMIWYNDVVLPEFNHRARKLAQSITRKNPAFTLEQGLFMREKNLNIFVEEIQRPLEENLTKNSNLVDPPYESAQQGNDRLRNVTIFDASAPGLQRTITANYGYLNFDRQREQLVFNLFDGEIHEIDTRNYADYRRLSFQRNQFNLRADDQVFKRVERGQRGDREMPIDTMRSIVAQKQSGIVEEKALRDDLFGTFLPPPDSLLLPATIPDSLMISSDLNYKAAGNAVRKIQSVIQKFNTSINTERELTRQVYKYGVEIHKKYSIPFACIVFVLVGAPLGIRARKGSIAVGVAFSIGFFLVYWICLIGGEDLADRQILQPWLAMWLPNIIVGTMGLILTVRTVQETQFFNWEHLPGVLGKFFRDQS